MKILVTGATGFVGHVLVEKLLENGHEVAVLTRNVGRAALKLGSKCQYFQWTSTSSLPPAEAFSGVNSVINLMGDNLSQGRWTSEKKKKIFNSRIDGTSNLVAQIKKLGIKLDSFVSTSAIGIYGPRGAEEITEESELGDDFLSHVCKSWEKKAMLLKDDTRVCLLRVGVVLGEGGGALEKMLPVFKLGLGGPLGNGRQIMSWVQRDDLAQMYLEAATNPKYEGVFNATAPYPLSNKEFSRVLGKVLKRPVLAPAPSCAIKLAFGEMSTILLDGQKVIPKKLKAQDFHFKYPTLEMALKETV